MPKSVSHVYILSDTFACLFKVCEISRRFLLYRNGTFKLPTWYQERYFMALSRMLKMPRIRTKVLRQSIYADMHTIKCVHKCIIVMIEPDAC